MTTTGTEPTQPKAPQSPRSWNGVVVAAFGLSAFVFLALPPLIVWWGSRDICPSRVLSKGSSDGAGWEVLRSDCGGDVGIVMQLRVIPNKGYSVVALESRGGPEPVGWEQKGFEGTIIIASAPIGETETRLKLKLDGKGLPVQTLRFKDGRRLE